MKTTYEKIKAIGLLLMFAMLVQVNPIYAQQDHHGNGQKGQQSDKREKMEAQRIAFITQELNLTPDEAKVFWPVYNEYDAKRHELKKSFKESSDLHKEDIAKLTEKEASAILDNQIIEAQKFLDLRKEYHAKFKSVLPAVKVLELYDAEREFQKMLIDKLRQHGQAPPDKK
ncbi:MAG: hypothetical protein WCI92_04495 [Bacteroidota bacterium]